jgi:hypothetical protein
MIDYGRVFILGAGFSKAFSKKMPCIQNLTNDLFGGKSAEGTRLGDIISEFNEINDPSHSVQTIENLTTVIFSKKIFFDQSDKMRYEELKLEILKHIYHQLVNYDVDDESETILLNFLNACFYHHGTKGTYSDNNLLVSFNYDLLLEKFLKKSDSQYRFEYGIPLQKHKPLQIGVPESVTRPFLYLKLHGSFNWFRAIGDDNSDILYHVDADDEYFFVHENEIPVFIPMAHAKEAFLNGTTFNLLWRKANYYLDNAREIFIIGYGFPTTDINNLLYFHKFRERIKEIVVLFNLENEEEKLNHQRLVDIFGKDKIINIDAKEYLANNYQKFCRIRLN